MPTTQPLKTPRRTKCQSWFIDHILHPFQQSYQNLTTTSKNRKNQKLKQDKNFRPQIWSSFNWSPNSLDRVAAAAEQELEEYLAASRRVQIARQRRHNRLGWGRTPPITPWGSPFFDCERWACKGVEGSVVGTDAKICGTRVVLEEAVANRTGVEIRLIRPSGRMSGVLLEAK